LNFFPTKTKLENKLKPKQAKSMTKITQKINAPIQNNLHRKFNKITENMDIFIFKFFSDLESAEKSEHKTISRNYRIFYKCL